MNNKVKFNSIGWSTSTNEAKVREVGGAKTKIEFNIEKIIHSGLFIVHELVTDGLPTLVNFDMQLECESKQSTWISVDVGYHIDNKFYFITFKHERFNKLLNVNLDPASIPFLIANDYNTPLEWCNVKIRIRVRLNGKGSVILTLSKPMQSNREQGYSLRSTIDNYNEFALHSRLLSGSNLELKSAFRKMYVLDSYWTKHNEIEKEAAKLFMEKGELHFSKLPPVKIDSSYPPLSVTKYPNYERRWYSLELVHILLSDWRYNNNSKALLAATIAAEKFISLDFYGVPENIKYIWYDHGTADRMVILTELYCCLIDGGGDKITLERLFYVIFRHAQALSCESFYLRNQRFKYHNHAVFQDRALIIIAEVFPAIKIFQAWKDLAINRCADQFENLINFEGVSIENSSGYHIAMQGIVSDMIKFYSSIKLTEHCLALQALEKNMDRFSTSLYYPDNTIVAFGDTSYKLNNKRPPKKLYVLEEEINYFEDSGYFFITGMTDRGCAFKFNLISSSNSLIHKHFDNLSFTLWVEGIEFIVDPGFFSHAQDEDSVFSKGPYAHNTSIPAGFSCENDWRESITESTIKVYMSSCAKKYKIVGKHSCYLGQSFTRSIFIYVSKGYILCRDKFQGNINLVNNIQLGDTLQVKQESNKDFSISSLIRSESIKIIYDDTVTAECVIGQNKPFISGWVYPKVGVKEAAYALNSKSWQNQLSFAISLNNESEIEIADIVNHFSGVEWNDSI
ncbi:heparinase II/III domain-containing protein [Microbulbifer spongiae]|uniref:Heparinase II/III family protein n=1 Tax=Microbulbifer spongiae TaxID=2944933 RepID=A0ABY9EEJ6_9GAMM|nr:heparinase II/III family protein [Microbulbifer sp. MI-G]WKD51448.1 heparinase II/III family protein [Microbulbifer sp. MI-G]